MNPYEDNARLHKAHKLAEHYVAYCEAAHFPVDIWAEAAEVASEKMWDALAHRAAVKAPSEATVKLAIKLIASAVEARLDTKDALDGIPTS